MASPQTPRLAILVADTPLPDIVDRLGAYPTIFKSWLVSSAFVETEVVLQEFDARDGQLPSDPTQFDGMIITGSKHSAYDDTPWIKDLIAYTARVASDFPQVRLIGTSDATLIAARVRLLSLFYLLRYLLWASNYCTSSRRSNKHQTQPRWLGDWRVQCRSNIAGHAGVRQ